MGEDDVPGSVMVPELMSELGAGADEGAEVVPWCVSEEEGKKDWMPESVVEDVPRTWCRGRNVQRR